MTNDNDNPPPTYGEYVLDQNPQNNPNDIDPIDIERLCKLTIYLSYDKIQNYSSFILFRSIQGLVITKLPVKYGYEIKEIESILKTGVVISAPLYFATKAIEKFAFNDLIKAIGERKILQENQLESAFASTQIDKINHDSENDIKKLFIQNFSWTKIILSAAIGGAIGYFVGKQICKVSDKITEKLSIKPNEISCKLTSFEAQSEQDLHKFDINATVSPAGVYGVGFNYSCSDNYENDSPQTGTLEIN